MGIIPIPITCCMRILREDNKDVRKDTKTIK